MTITNHNYNPLHRGIQKTIKVEHKEYDAVQYEFYFPQSVWSNSATKSFIIKIGNLAPGATIFKGATGIWKEDEEDINIYRLILGGDEFNKGSINSLLYSEIGQLMAYWAEWDESIQEAFLFTETDIKMTISSLPQTKYRKAKFNNALHTDGAPLRSVPTGEGYESKI